MQKWTTKCTHDEHFSSIASLSWSPLKDSSRRQLSKMWKVNIIFGDYFLFAALILAAGEIPLCYAEPRTTNIFVKNTTQQRGHSEPVLVLLPDAVAGGNWLDKTIQLPGKRFRGRESKFSRLRGTIMKLRVTSSKTCWKWSQYLVPTPDPIANKPTLCELWSDGKQTANL